MEKIKINEIVKKDSGLVIVKYEALHEVLGVLAPFKSGEATLNTRWQAQQVDYLEKDVGIGGSVSVVIKQKGDYTNITEVDFKSAEKGNIPGVVNPQEVHTGSSLMSQKEISIVSQCLTKAWVQTEKDPAEILDAYHFFVKSLEDNG